MGNALLIVVWLGLGGGTNYQVQFATDALCHAAREVVFKDAIAERTRIGSNNPIAVSAVCVARNEPK
jgi:hypothetical protein